jgi:tol-pal system protein YbgF
MVMRRQISLCLVALVWAGRALAETGVSQVDLQAEIKASRLNAGVVAQLEELKEQIKALRGEIEKLQFSDSKLDERFGKFSADFEYRITQIEKERSEEKENKKLFDNLDSNLDNDVILQRGVVAGGSDKAQDSKAGVEEAVVKDPILAKKVRDKEMEQEYQDAYSVLKNKNYKKARDDFRAFVQKYPESDLVGSAYYWVGETFFTQNEYEKAAVEYLKGYQIAMRGMRAPDNLLKLAKSLAKMKGHKQEACLTLQKLQTEFPNAQSAIKKQIEDDYQSLKCK